MNKMVKEISEGFPFLASSIESNVVFDLKDNEDYMKFDALRELFQSYNMYYATLKEKENQEKFDWTSNKAVPFHQTYPIDYFCVDSYLLDNVFGILYFDPRLMKRESQVPYHKYMIKGKTYPCSIIKKSILKNYEIMTKIEKIDTKYIHNSTLHFPKYFAVKSSNNPNKEASLMTEVFDAFIKHKTLMGMDNLKEMMEEISSW